MTRKPDEEQHASREGSTAPDVYADVERMTLAVRLPDGEVCVGILDLPQTVRLRGVCRCGACHADLADPAVDYL